MDLPDIPPNRDLTYVGYSTYRDKNQLFGIKRKDRRQHIYILGKSGTGKSVLMFNMIIQNILNGEGVCVVDPHGELVEGVLQAIPPHRIKDVVYFNPADVDYQIGFNVLELVDAKYKHLVASGLMGIFTKIWANAWSARMEYILNNCILALLDTPGTTLLGIPRMLVDKDYRQKIIGNLKDPVIKAFWIHEYEAWQDKFRNEAIAPIQNKVGQFLSTSVIRNIVGQSKSTINIFDMMNEGKIFLVNVSKGRIGEDNSKLLGGMIITKIQLAAMERVRIPEDERKDFYLYVDEFQNFVTDSFASILSEARKYRLNLTVAHQYTAQLVTKESSAMRDSIFGNVGTMIVFRVGADDADFLEKEFMPEFVPEDIVNLPNYKIYLKLMIDGVTSRPFSAKTMAPLVKGGNEDIEQEVIRSSRELYCKSREEAEKEINDWSGMALGDGSGSTSGNVSGNNNSYSTGPGGERFKAVCSTCGKETEVPFKPEPGRPVYCKECIAKIKAGELKPVKSSPTQVKYDETKFFKPLSDLGIEFPSTEVVVKEVKPSPIEKPKEIIKENIETPVAPPQINQTIPPRPGVLGAIKNVFVKKPHDTAGLKDILNKALAENKIVEKIPEVKKEEPKPISLSELKPQPQKVGAPTDRSANADAMNSLKSMIAEKVEKVIEPVKVEPPRMAPAPAPTPIPKFTPPPIVLQTKAEVKVEPRTSPAPAPVNPTPPPIMQTPPPAPPSSSSNYFNQIRQETSKVKEIPEDVLRRILNSDE
ncbi:MAG: type IV secretion system DNA-binding domain-containing protein [bacterium]|nr:type IV secretion system DNA-binding domain-containing protein [bacterium]